MNCEHCGKTLEPIEQGSPVGECCGELQYLDDDG
uniref:Uncharacterized protein n=1 Tax=viral metagenome TaxID=1070528 RepID=A0A6C0CHA5_9ZZZZ